MEDWRRAVSFWQAHCYDLALALEDVRADAGIASGAPAAGGLGRPEAC